MNSKKRKTFFDRLLFFLQHNTPKKEAMVFSSPVIILRFYSVFFVLVILVMPFSSQKVELFAGANAVIACWLLLKLTEHFTRGELYGERQEIRTFFKNLNKPAEKPKFVNRNYLCIGTTLHNKSVLHQAFAIEETNNVVNWELSFQQMRESFSAIFIVSLETDKQGTVVRDIKSAISERRLVDSERYLLHVREIYDILEKAGCEKQESHRYVCYKWKTLPSSSKLGKIKTKESFEDDGEFSEITK